jgi:Ca2+-binding RTX toxin-like protein
MRTLAIATVLTWGAAGVALVALPAPAESVARAAVPTCHGVRATIVGTPAPDVIRGTPGRDVIVGLAGNDEIHARGGNDLVCGGGRDDRLYGGAGDDVLYGGGGGDVLSGGSGDDRLYGGRDGLSSAQEDGLQRIGDTVRGGPGNDRMSAGADHRRADIVVPDVMSWEGSSHGVHIDLRTGIARGEGRDTFVAGVFRTVGSSHPDVIEGTRRSDHIDAGAGSDVVRGRGGSDVINADDSRHHHGRDADRVWGGAGNDRISGLGGEDHIDAGPGRDWIESGGDAGTVLLGGAGSDDLWVTVGRPGGSQRFDGGPGVDGIQIDTPDTPSTGTWDMATGAMTFTADDAVSLTVLSIERPLLGNDQTAWTVTGTPGDDNLFGDPNSVSSPVTFDGLAGDDTFAGTDGDDTFDGGPGQDHTFGMLDGDDTCISVEVIDGSDCEHVTP